MHSKPLAAAVLAASIALAAPTALAEGDQCFVSAFTGKVSTMFADAKAFLGLGGNGADGAFGGLTEFTRLLDDPATKKKMQEFVQAKLGNEEAESTEAEPVASCCATASRAETAAAAASDPRLEALAKVFGPAVTKKASVAKADDAGCAAEAASCPLEATTDVAAKVEAEQAEVNTAALPVCCAKKREAATD